ncbi:phosphodiester glycosidase family protein [Allonocardiopsis opalescens]|uniref:Calcineurin-like phosphoesterase family protein n=1 Tax=Allonocardiopsis opalescens TaxID=1144618 RepID=A0A2T0Q054_9ACTN|nr:phosphodiester glycosidase family protein [Allonocardiopsis opalescens]PRX97164.1 calcineurin-like phosphoesterase family protein [Allonocardiopsis opalescens]
MPALDSSPSPTPPPRRAGGARRGRAAWRALAAPLSLAVVLGLAGTGYADPAPSAGADPVAASAPAAAAASSGGPAAVPLTAGASAAERIDTRSWERPVAPGVELAQADSYDPRGWQRITSLSLDLDGGARVEYLSPGSVAETEVISAQADRVGAVAAINGDFFDINNSGAPLGAAVADGEIIKSPTPDWPRAVTVDAEGVGRVQDILFDGTVTLPGGELALDQLNSPQLRSGGVAAFTSLWGEYPRSRAVQGAAQVTEVVVVDGVVTEVRDAAGEGPIGADTTVLVGREAGAARLAELAPGDPVAVDYELAGLEGAALDTAIGGRQLLVEDGRVREVNDVTPEPRTAVGFSEDGTDMYLVTADGRQANSRGATLREMGERLRELGAHVGLELDGGGSSTLAARLPGGDSVQVENDPGSETERPVPNGLAVFAAEGSGRLDGVWVDTAIDATAAPGAGPVAGGRPDRVFTGLTRSLVATGHDEAYGPVEGDPAIRWNARGSGSVRDGVFQGRRPGEATVTARAGSAQGSIELEVLGEPVRAAATESHVALSGAGATGSFGVVGFDEHGYTAPIEPADVRLDFDPALVDVQPGADGSFTVSAVAESGSGTVTAEVAGLSTSLAVTVGVEERVLADFSDAAAWTAGSARGTAQVAPAPGREGGEGLRLSYDFTQSTATRTAYAIPPAPLAVDGQARALSIWVDGRGRGEWTAFTVIDATGRSHSLYGPYITWQGWQELTIPVPDALPQPIRVSRFYTIELGADRQYRAEVALDDISVQVAPTAQIPPSTPVADDVIITDGTVEGAEWRFAVMSDAQFVARNPDSEFVQRARRTLQEVRAADPDFLIINGDFVDEASDADFQLAARILAEELEGELPYHYVPGNHEVMGGDIANFRRHFGETTSTFDHEGTRFITLDTSRGTLLGGGFEQIRLLREQLDAAAQDPSVGSVVLTQHHPPRDPSPAAGSQLADRREAAMIEAWLAEFQEETGKGALFVGAHVGRFHAAGVDGVPYVINGNSGKAPSADADNGGFSGWSLVGVDPVTAAEAEAARADAYDGGPDWVGVEFRPHVEDLVLDTPDTLAAGESATAGASVVQEGRHVPVRYPVSADWTGTGLHIGTPGGHRPSHIASFDPATGTLTALRPGTVEIAVTVNGATRTATVEVAQ